MTKTVHMEFKCDLAIEWKYKYTQGICIKSKVSGSSQSYFFNYIVLIEL